MSSPVSADPRSVVSEALEDGLGHRFGDPDLLEIALTHRSWCAEHEASSNERLEFLGDAVLGFAVAERVYRDHPGLPEGQLALIRAAVVSTPALADVARSIPLGEALRLGRGESSTGGNDKDSILADALEAVVAAVYLDGGPAAVRTVVDRLFTDVLADSAVDPGLHDFKTRLQELAARLSDPPPRYVLTDDGPDHDKRFHAMVEVAGRSYGPATGTSRKRAEQEAARLAWDALEHPPPVKAGTPTTDQEST